MLSVLGSDNENHSTKRPAMKFRKFSLNCFAGAFSGMGCELSGTR